MRSRVMSADDIFHRAIPEPNSGCWLWCLHVGDNGYAKVWFDGANRIASRVSWILARGPISDDLTIDHLCRVRCCVNPDHLEPVPQAINIARGDLPELLAARNRLAASLRTACKKGHPYTPESTRFDSNGRRYCRICHAAFCASWERTHKRRSVR